MKSKCVVGVADDLTFAQQAVQAAHAAQVFAGRNPGRYTETTLIIKAVPAQALAAVHDAAPFDRRVSSKFAAFHEPDLGGRLTALALSGPISRKLDRYGLAFRTP